MIMLLHWNNLETSDFDNILVRKMITEEITQSKLILWEWGLGIWENKSTHLAAQNRHLNILLWKQHNADRVYQPSVPTHQALRNPRFLHSLQCIIDPAVVAGVLRRGSPEPENHRAVVIGSQPQKLLQATHTLIGYQPLLTWRQGVHRPERVILKHRKGDTWGRRSDICLTQVSVLLQLQK